MCLDMTHTHILVSPNSRKHMSALRRTFEVLTPLRSWRERASNVTHCVLGKDKEKVRGMATHHSLSPVESATANLCLVCSASLYTLQLECALRGTKKIHKFRRLDIVVLLLWFIHFGVSLC